MSESNLVQEVGDRPGCGEDRGKARNGTFAINVGNDALEFRYVDLSDPVPMGRQIIEAAGPQPGRGVPDFRGLA